MKHFLDVLMKTTVSRANVVLLDEPELGLHPDLQRRFFGYLHRLAEERNIQFFKRGFGGEDVPVPVAMVSRDSVLSAIASSEMRAM